MRSQLLFVVIFIGISFPPISPMDTDWEESLEMTGSAERAERSQLTNPAIFDDEDEDLSVTKSLGRFKLGDSESSSGYGTEPDDASSTDEATECVKSSCACKLEKKEISSDGYEVYHWKNKDVTYQQANICHFDQILNLCQKIRADRSDSKKLLMRPGTFLDKWIEVEINAGNFYVAINRDGRVIAFVRAFVVKQRLAIESLLKHELKSTCPQKQIKESQQCIINLKEKRVPGHSALVNTDITITPLRKRNHSFKQWKNNQIFLYYGTHFVEESNRGLGVGSKLLDFAFKCQFFDVIKGIDYRKESVQFVLTYGNVQGNSHLAALRCFARLVENLCCHVSNSDFNTWDMRKVTLFCYSYWTHKPIFYIDKEELKMMKVPLLLIDGEADPIAWEDESRMVVYTLLGGLKLAGTPPTERRFYHLDATDLRV